LWRFDEYPGSFTIISQSSYHLRCVQKTCLFSINGLLYLLSGDTSGILVLWHIINGQLSIPLQTWKAHQSGIKALDILITNLLVKVASGGDDGSISVLELTITKQAVQSSLKVFTAANWSSVTGISFLTNTKLITVSIDQYIKQFDFSQGFVLQSEKLIDVPDVGDMAVLGNCVVVVGHGLQTFKIEY
jgi:WD40 repeat protein